MLRMLPTASDLVEPEAPSIGYANLLGLEALWWGGHQY